MRHLLMFATSELIDFFAMVNPQQMDVIHEVQSFLPLASVDSFPFGLLIS